MCVQVLPGVPSHACNQYAEAVWANGPPQWQSDAISVVSAFRTAHSVSDMTRSSVTGTPSLAAAAAAAVPLNTLPGTVAHIPLVASSRSLAATVSLLLHLARHQLEMAAAMDADRLVSILEQPA